MEIKMGTGITFLYVLFFSFHDAAPPLSIHLLSNG